jgi:hypothetical protein
VEEAMARDGLGNDQGFVVPVDEHQEFVVSQLISLIRTKSWIARVRMEFTEPYRRHFVR